MRKFRMHSVLTIILVITPISAVAQQNRDPAKTPVVYSVPGMTQAVVRSNVVFDNSTTAPLALDAYLPRDLRKGERRPAIIFISGAERVRQWRWFVTWGQLAAAHGMIGIVPDKRYQRGLDGLRTGAADTEKLLAFLRTQGDALGVDPARICLWTFSAGGRLTSVGLQADKTNAQAVRCLVSFYGVLDMSGEVSSITNEAEREAFLKRYSPVQALESLIAAGAKSPPVFLARAGKDVAFINNGIDRFVATGLRLNVPINLMNYADGEHGFDGFNDTPESRAIIKAALRWVQEQSVDR